MSGLGSVQGTCLPAEALVRLRQSPSRGGEKMASRGVQRTHSEKQALKQHTKKAEREKPKKEGRRRDFVNEIEFNNAATGGHADEPIPTRPNSRSALADQRRAAEKGAGTMSLSKKLDAEVRVAGARRPAGGAARPAEPEPVSAAPDEIERGDRGGRDPDRAAQPRPARRPHRRGGRSPRASHDEQAHRRDAPARAGAGQRRQPPQGRVHPGRRRASCRERVRHLLGRRAKAAEAARPRRKGRRRLAREGRRRGSRGVNRRAKRPLSEPPSFGPVSCRQSIDRVQHG